MKHTRLHTALSFFAALVLGSTGLGEGACPELAELSGSTILYKDTSDVFVLQFSGGMLFDRREEMTFARFDDGAVRFRIRENLFQLAEQPAEIRFTFRTDREFTCSLIITSLTLENDGNTVTLRARYLLQGMEWGGQANRGSAIIRAEFGENIVDAVNSRFFSSALQGLLTISFLPENPDVVTGITGAADDAAVLLPAFPNPFGGGSVSGQSSTIMRFVVNQAGPVRLTIHDASGREIARPVDTELMPGAHQVVFTPTRFPSGNYFVRLTAGNETTMKKIVYVR